MRLRIIRHISTLALGLFAGPLPAKAKQAKKIPRIGYLSLASAEVNRSYLIAFRQGLRELGYSEGKNILIAERFAERRFERLPKLAAELIRLKVDIIVTHGGQWASAVNRAAKEAGRTIPIVFPVDSDPVGTGLVASLERPGGNVTGLSDYHAHMAPRRLEFLKEVAPLASRVAVLLEPDLRTHVLQLEDLQAAAPAVGMTILPFKVRKLNDIDHAFAAMEKEHAGAIIILGSAVITNDQRRFADLALKSCLPAIYTSSRWVTAGGLMGYEASLDDLYRRAATYVDKILKGAKPADLPVEQPRKYDLAINLKTAEALGLTIPPVILLQATKVIK